MTTRIDTGAMRKAYRDADDALGAIACVDVRTLCDEIDRLNAVVAAQKAQLDEAHAAVAEATEQAQREKFRGDAAIGAVGEMHGDLQRAQQDRDGAKLALSLHVEMCDREHTPVYEIAPPKDGATTMADAVREVVARAEKAEAQVAALRALAREAYHSEYLPSSFLTSADPGERCWLQRYKAALADTDAVAARYVDVDNSDLEQLLDDCVSRWEEAGSIGVIVKHLPAAVAALKARRGGA